MVNRGGKQLTSTSSRLHETDTLQTAYHWNGTASRRKAWQNQPAIGPGEKPLHSNPRATSYHTDFGICGGVSTITSAEKHRNESLPGRSTSLSFLPRRRSQSCVKRQSGPAPCTTQSFITFTTFSSFHTRKSEFVTNVTCQFGHKGVAHCSSYKSEGWDVWEN